MSASILCLLFWLDKKIGDFRIKNNIVNALTQYVISAKIPLNPTRNAAKLGRIFGISIKNEKKMRLIRTIYPKRHKKDVPTNRSAPDYKREPIRNPIFFVHLQYIILYPIRPWTG